MKTPITTQPVRQSSAIDGFEKGRLFEQYVIQLFNQYNFKFAEWRMSQKLEDKLLLQDCGNPDLELIFSRHKNHHFAVECKWREKFVDGKIKWAHEHQIRSYKNFENQRRIPVFIAIGIGGEPSKPEKLFVTPLRNIEMYSEVYEADLIPYKRKPTRRFFYDTVQLKLFWFLNQKWLGFTSLAGPAMEMLIAFAAVLIFT